MTGHGACARCRMLTAAIFFTRRRWLAPAPCTGQGFCAGARGKKTHHRRRPAMFSQVLNQIRVNHPDSIDTHRLFMAAVQGMVTAADPHSFVIPAVRLDAAKEEAFREGRLNPVPVSFRFVGGDPVVASVAVGSRASRLDILPGDVLIAIMASQSLPNQPPSSRSGWLARVARVSFYAGAAASGRDCRASHARSRAREVRRVIRDSGCGSARCRNRLRSRDFFRQHASR